MIRRFINWLLRKQPEPNPEVDLEAWARSHPEQARMVMPPQVFDEIKRRHDVRRKGQP